jgi:hypothetical protein
MNHALFIYDDTARRMIHNFKYGGHQEIARAFGEYINAKREAGVFDGIDMLTYVPIHAGRLRRRRRSLICPPIINTEVCNESTLLCSFRGGAAFNGGIRPGSGSTAILTALQHSGCHGSTRPV